MQGDNFALGSLVAFVRSVAREPIVPASLVKVRRELVRLPGFE
jgi:hypothetical protein